MFKLAKYLFIATLVFSGLYFFGDFRINDTNVREYLHKNVTWDRATAIKNEFTSWYRFAKRLLESDSEEESDSKESTKKPTTTDKNKNAAPMDELTGKDHKKLMNFLKDNIDELEKSQKWKRLSIVRQL